jgi:hypothetical protein
MSNHSNDSTMPCIEDKFWMLDALYCTRKEQWDVRAHNSYTMHNKLSLFSIIVVQQLVQNKMKKKRIYIYIYIYIYTHRHTHNVKNTKMVTW